MTTVGCLPCGIDPVMGVIGSPVATAVVLARFYNCQAICDELQGSCQVFGHVGHHVDQVGLHPLHDVKNLPSSLVNELQPQKNLAAAPAIEGKDSACSLLVGAPQLNQLPVTNLLEESLGDRMP